MKKPRFNIGDTVIVNEDFIRDNFNSSIIVTTFFDKNPCIREIIYNGFGYYTYLVGDGLLTGVREEDLKLDKKSKNSVKWNPVFDFNDRVIIRKNGRIDIIDGIKLVEDRDSFIYILNESDDEYHELELIKVEDEVAELFKL